MGENSLENIHEEAYLDYGRSLVDSRNVGTEIEGVSSEKKGSWAERKYFFFYHLVKILQFIFKLL